MISCCGRDARAPARLSNSSSDVSRRLGRGESVVSWGASRDDGGVPPLRRIAGSEAGRCHSCPKGTACRASADRQDAFVGSVEHSEYPCGHAVVPASSGQLPTFACAASTDHGDSLDAGTSSVEDQEPSIHSSGHPARGQHRADGEAPAGGGGPSNITRRW